MHFKEMGREVWRLIKMGWGTRYSNVIDTKERGTKI